MTATINYAEMTHYGKPPLTWTPELRRRSTEHVWKERVVELITRMKSLLITGTIFLVGAAFVTATIAGHYGSKGMHSMDLVHTAYKSNLKTLVSAIEAADLTDTLMNGGPFTIFAPTNEAFADLPEGTLDSLLKPVNKSKLAAILTYHVVPW